MFASSRLLFLSSTHADSYKVANRNDDVSFTLSQPIIAQSGQQMHIRVVDATIPSSAYNVPATQNTVYVTYNGTPATITVPAGFYTISTFVSQLNTLTTSAVGTNATWSYSLLSSEISLSWIGAGNFVILGTTTMWRQLGVGGKNASITVATGTTVAMPWAFDLSGPRSCIISSESAETVSLHSTGTPSPYSTNLICKVPMSAAYGSMNEYVDQSGFSQLITNNFIGEMHIALLDEEQQPLDLNGVTWTVTIMIDVF